MRVPEPEVHGLQMVARSPNARVRDGEHGRAALVRVKGTCGPSLSTLSAQWACTTAVKKNSESHSPLSLHLTQSSAS